MREESEAVNESFWDAPGVEIEACADFVIFPEFEKIEESMLWESV